MHPVSQREKDNKYRSSSDLGFKKAKFSISRWEQSRSQLKCNKMKARQVQFSSAQLSSVQFSSVHFSSVHFSSVQFSSLPQCTLHCLLYFNSMVDGVDDRSAVTFITQMIHNHNSNTGLGQNSNFLSKRKKK